MRAVLCRPGPSFSVQDVANGWLGGLRSVGVDVCDYRFDHRLIFYGQASVPKGNGKGRRYRRALSDEDAVRLAAKGLEVSCYEWWPDVVVIVSGFFVPPEQYELMRSRGHKVVLLCTESPYEDAAQLAKAPYADLVLLNDPTHLAEFRAVNPNTHYLPHAYDPDVHHRREPHPDYVSDFCFVGTGYPSRTAFFEAVDWSGIDVCLGGNWQATDESSVLRKFLAHDIAECVDNDVAVQAYSSTKASANFYRRESETPELAHGWSMGPREVELAAVGTFYLTEARGENRDVLPMVPTFEGPDDFAERLRWYLAHDDERERIAAAAQAAIAERTFANNARALLSLLG